MNLWEEIASANLFETAPTQAPLFAARKKVVNPGLKRIEAEESTRTGWRPSRKTSQAIPKVLALTELIIGEREKGPLKSRNDLLDLAIVEEFLDWAKDDESPATPAEKEIAAALWTRLDAVISKALEAKQVPKRPAQLAREVLPPLNDALEKAKNLVFEGLFIPPRLEALMANDKAQVAQTIQNLKERETKVLEESQWLEGERRKCALAGDPPKDPKVAQRVAELEQKWKALTDKTLELTAEETRFEVQLRTLERKYPAASGISAFDPRRRSVFKAFDPTQISSDEVTERLGSVKALAQSLEQKLTELEAKLPPPCRDSEGVAVNPRFWCFARIAALREKERLYPNLEDKESYSLLYRGGTLYRDIKIELDEVVNHLQALGTEFQSHLRIVNEVKDLVRQGDVFVAEKRFKGLVPKFKEIRYQNTQALIDEALRIHRDAQRLATDAAEYHAKCQGFFAKMFRDRAKQKELEQRLLALQAKAASLPKSELSRTVSGLLQDAESKIRF